MAAQVGKNYKNKKLLTKQSFIKKKGKTKN